MRVLILGSEGFIGGHCVSFFTTQGDTVFGLDLFERPSRDYSYRKVSRLSPELEELFSQETFDAVINASGSGNVPYSMTHPVIDFEANSLDTIRVLDTIRKYQPACRYIHISSAAVYGNPRQLPVLEDALLEPMSPYGWHKLISEQLCQEYSSIYSLRIAIVRPFSVYGPGLRKQLFWDLYRKITTSTGNSIELFGTGAESRDFIHVQDLVAAINLILKNGTLQGEVYNAAAGIETTIRDVVGIFVTALRSSVQYKFNGETRSGDPLNWRASITKLGELGFVPRYSLQDGLSELADWLVKDSNHS